MRGRSIGFERSQVTDADGRYEITAIPVARHEVSADASGFRAEVIQSLAFEVGRTLVRDFLLVVGDQRENVIKEFPPRQKAASFSLDPVIDKMTAASQGS